MNETEQSLHDAVVMNLKGVYDPEISLNVHDLGLIYNIDVKDFNVKILMTLTSAFCPAADDILSDVTQAAWIAGAKDVDVDITFSPQWGPEHISEDGKLILGIWD